MFLRGSVAALGIVTLLAAAAPVEARPALAKAVPFAFTAAKADRVIVVKSERKLYLMNGEQVLKVYSVALGRYAMGHKIKKGDSRTPEGVYTLDSRLKESAFYKAIHISYPNVYDAMRAEFLEVDPGGAIMIHGLPNKITAKQVNHPVLDWTQGCIAVTNREIDEIWSLVKDGTEIEIRP